MLVVCCIRFSSSTRLVLEWMQLYHIYGHNVDFANILRFLAYYPDKRSNEHFVSSACHCHPLFCQHIRCRWFWFYFVMRKLLLMSSVCSCYLVLIYSYHFPREKERWARRRVLICCVIFVEFRAILRAEMKRWWHQHLVIRYSRLFHGIRARNICRRTKRTTYHPMYVMMHCWTNELSEYILWFDCALYLWWCLLNHIAWGSVNHCSGVMFSWQCRPFGT